MFRTDLLSIIRSLNTVSTVIDICHPSYVYYLLARSGWNWSSSARALFSGCSSTTNAHSETGQMAVCCQNLPLGELSSRSAPFLLVGELFNKFSLFLNTGVFSTNQYI
jgi:hypothetical protein